MDKSRIKLTTINMKSDKKLLIDKLALLCSYFGLFVLWSFLVNYLLAPWDGALLEQRPPIGTIDRTLNNFFESNIYGSTIPLLILVLVSLAICIYKLKSNYKDSTKSIIHLTSTNLLYIGVLTTFSVIYLTISSSNPADYNPYAITLHAFAILALFAVQITGFKPKLKSTQK
jgi:hypothetical protein